MADKFTKEEFIRRFVDEMIRLADRRPLRDGDGETREVRSYAIEIAGTYFESVFCIEGPEACAQTEFSYWNEK